MSELRESIERSIPIDRLIDNYQEHPNTIGVKILKDKLKQEKLKDKILYQSFKE